jgi:hypothetical protein
LLYRAWLQVRIFARASRKAAAVAFAWIAVQSAALAHSGQRLLNRAWLEWRIFARASLNAASAGSTRAAAKSRVYARVAQRSAIAGASWLWASTGSLARASLDGLVFVGAKTQRLFDKRIVPSVESAQPAEASMTQAAIISQCRALVCIEPWRARLPAIRQLNGATPGLSWQLPPRSAARPPA